MKRLLLTVLSLLLLLTPLLAGEEESDSYTFESLKESMRSGNAELRKATETYNQSLLDVKDAKANYQPQISLLLSGTYMPNPPIGKTSIGVDELSSQLGVTIPGSASGEYVTLYKGMDSLYYNAGLTITQPIFTWGKIPKAVDLYSEIASIRALSVEDSADKLTVELKTRLTAKCYMDELFTLIAETKEKADELVDMSQDAYDNGMLLKEDVTKAKISALEIDVKEQELRKQYADNLKSLQTITANDGLDAENIDYTVNEDEISALAALEHDDVISLVTRSDSATISMLRSQTRAYELKKEIAEASLYWKPDFALQVSLTYGGSAMPLIEKNWYRANDYGLYLTFAISTTVWDGGVKLNDVKRAKSEIEGTKADYDSAVNQLTETAEENLSQIELSLVKLEYYDLKLEEAEERLDLLNRQYDAGSISRTDILSQEIEILTEKMTIIQEKVTLSQAAYTIAYLTGILD